jgi:hypothetical protein
MTKWGIILVAIGIAIVFWHPLFSPSVPQPGWDLSEFQSLWSEEALRPLAGAVFSLVGVVFLVRGLLASLKQVKVKRHRG